MKKFKKSLIFIIILFFVNVVDSKELKIIKVIGDEIITNVDLDNQYNFFIALNEELKKIEQKKVYDFALNRLINEKIKLMELKNYYDFKIESEYSNNAFKNFYKSKNFKSENEFQNFLMKYNLNLNIIKKQIKIESLWNQLIYEKFNYQVKIDLDEIEKKINLISKKTIQYEYNISEILFVANNKDELNLKKKKITESIKFDGFDNAAIIYNENTFNKSGKIGWISDDVLPENINNKVKTLNKGEITEPLKVSNGFIILKLNDKRKIEKKIDINKRKEKLISDERNNQLNQYSLMYFNKISKNAKVKEL